MDPLFIAPVLPTTVRKRPGASFICAATRTTRSGRRKRLGVLPGNFSQDKGPICESFLRHLKRLVRARSFIRKIPHQHVRFTGIIFQRPNVVLDWVDGIPTELETYSKRADFLFINIPPGLVLRAETSSGAKLPGGICLCAVFETYGKGDFEKRQEELEKSEKELEKQFLAWGDLGQSMRTETDLTDLGGAELFHENYQDYLD